MPTSALTQTMHYWLPALMILAMYRRIRRNFGVQIWSPVKAWIRLIVLSLVVCLLLAVSLLAPQTLLLVGAGAALGCALAFFGLKHTHVHWTDGKRSYTPNPWIGSLLTALLVGRLAWRWTNGGFAAAQQAPSGLTFGIAMILIVYSLVYIIGLMVQMRQLLEATPTTVSADPQ